MFPTLVSPAAAALLLGSSLVDALTVDLSSTRNGLCLRIIYAHG